MPAGIRPFHRYMVCLATPPLFKFNKSREHYLRRRCPLHLFCGVHGDLDAEAEDSVSVLKEYIKDKKRPELDSVAPDRLKIWKWNWPTNKVEDLNIKDALDPRHTIGDVFKGDTPRKGWMHIIIKVPSSMSFFDRRDPTPQRLTKRLPHSLPFPRSEEGLLVGLLLSSYLIPFCGRFHATLLFWLRPSKQI